MLIKCFFYGTKIRSYQRYENIINAANDAMTAAAVDFNHIEHNYFDVAMNYTTNGILLLQKVYNNEVDLVIESENGEVYKLEKTRNGVSIKFYQILNGLGYSATMNLSAKVQERYGGISKIKFYPHVIAELKGNFSGKFGARESGFKINDHYKLLINLYHFLKNNPNKVKDYRVEFRISAKNIEGAKLIAFKFCNEAKLSSLFGRSGRQLRYHVLPVQKYFDNLKLLLNIVRNNGLSSSSQDKKRLYAQNICLHDVYNAFGMNVQFFGGVNGPFYLNNIYDKDAWFNNLTDKNGLTLNMGVIAENDRVVKLFESSSYFSDDDEDNNIEVDVGNINNNDTLRQSNVDEITAFVTREHNTFIQEFNVYSLADNNMGEVVDDEIAEIDRVLEDIKNSVRILSRQNSFQFCYSSSKFSTSFTSMDKLCDFIFKSFGKEFPNYVITNDHIDEVNDIQDDDVIDPVDPNIINDIIRNVKCTQTNKGWRYYFKSNLLCTRFTAATHEELAKYIYQTWKEKWQDHCALLKNPGPQSP